MARKSKAGNKLKLDDIYTDAEVNEKYEPFRVIKTPMFINEGKTYKLKDKFVRDQKKLKKAKYLSQKTVEGTQTNTFVEKRGDLKDLGTMRLPSDLIQMKRKLKITNKGAKTRKSIDDLTKDFESTKAVMDKLKLELDQAKKASNTKQQKVKKTKKTKKNKQKKMKQLKKELNSLINELETNNNDKVDNNIMKGAESGSEFESLI